ncbi:MAG: UvrD-helicase domain-containing protein, partial [Pseudomonadota bacterium]
MSGHDAVTAQRRAADPTGSAWVAANAGSGKTRVLTERVARLLLDGARPEKILCLTYTKAAAAEMQNRLFAMLGGWAMAEDAEIGAALASLTGGAAPAGEDALDRARRLFAEALETPGGLKIQTIHAFCDNLLRRFPLEAGAPPDFRVMEEREQRVLIAEVLEAMAARPGPDCDAFRGLAAILDEGGIEARAAAVVRDRALFPNPPDEPAISAAFGVAWPPEEAAARIAAFAAVDGRALSRMIVAWGAGAKTDQNRAVALDEAAERGEDDLAIQLMDAMLKKDGAPRAKPASKAAQAAEPDWARLCAHLTDAALAIREAGTAAAAAEKSLRLARFGGAFAAAYEAAKTARSLLDFDDLVGKARALLTAGPARDWVLYRLDGGVDHVLVDEAQDTSPAQWDVIDAIASEFRAGDGVRDAGGPAGRRTSFVVGDEKQSIYSFQGAAPGKFDEMRRRFKEGLAPHGGQNEVALTHSFRSAPAILRAVDAVFAGERAVGLTAGGAPPVHAAFHDGRAGRVELWPLIEPEADP